MPMLDLELVGARAVPRLAQDRAVRGLPPSTKSGSGDQGRAAVRGYQVFTQDRGRLASRFPTVEHIVT